jgi:hypothetical protein
VNGVLHNIQCDTNLSTSHVYKGNLIPSLIILIENFSLTVASNLSYATKRGNNRYNFRVIKNLLPDKNVIENYKVRFVSSLYLSPKGSEFKLRTDLCWTASTVCVCGN